MLKFRPIERLHTLSTRPARGFATPLRNVTICCLLAISGCSGLPVNPVSPYSYETLPATPPRVTFVRNQNLGINSVITSVAINDWVIGTLAPGEHLSFSPAQGLHYVSVKGKTVPLTFRNGREYFVLIEQDFDGSTKSIRPIYPREAAQYMQSETYQTAY